MFNTTPRRRFLKFKHFCFSVPRSAKLFTWTLFGIVAFLYFLLQWNNNPVAIQQPFIYIEPMNSYYRYSHGNKLMDWHDYGFIEKEKKRAALGGPGENGSAVFLTKEEEVLSEAVMKENKHNGLVSNKIARDRTVPDTRPKECYDIKYMSDLPSVSVVIPFHNEVFSTLTRTIHSIFNRTPPELLKEIILVNDHSDKDHCYGPLGAYIKEHFDTSKIVIIVMPQRSGLMWARLAGARKARGDVLVFLDCHIEANINWLPPLIEPIAKNYRAVTCPYIDVINKLNYKYEPHHATRGVFNWNLIYTYVPLRPEDVASPTSPHTTPVMMGCAFAVSAKWFWESGGYDTGLSIWGGEQFEMSFKTWLCGGVQYELPCSRVAHLFRTRPFTQIENKNDYYKENMKRVALIWLDEYAQNVFNRDPRAWAKIEAGDISRMLKLKKKLRCKPFKYFLDEVAPDMLDHFPPVEDLYASGAIQSVAYPKYCIDKLHRDIEERAGLNFCSADLAYPSRNQHVVLRNHRDLLFYKTNELCLDHSVRQDWIVIWPCSYEQNNQYFRYDYETKQIIVGAKRNNKCIDMEVADLSLFVSACDVNKTTQKWEWGGTVDKEKLKNWVNHGKTIRDPIELTDLKQ